jgi:hypothetical protein
MAHSEEEECAGEVIVPYQVFGLVRIARSSLRLTLQSQAISIVDDAVENGICKSGIG